MLIYLVEDDNSIRELLLFGAPAPKDDRIWFCLT